MLTKIDLTGEWQIEGFDIGEGQPRLAYKKEYTPEDPIPCQVPGIVQNALLENERIPDPYYEKNNEKLLWVETKEWWFYKEFIVPEDYQNKKFTLIFEGINYYANIWIDGLSVGNQEGMFLKTEYDISRFVKPGKKHKLSLRIRLPENSIEDRPKGKLKRGIVWSSVVTAPFSYWWNWAPHLVPIGIWKPAYIKVSDGVELSDVQIVSKIHWSESLEAESALLEISCSLKSFLNKKIQFRLSGSVEGVNFSYNKKMYEDEGELEFNEDKRIKFIVKIDNPKLWWPNGTGSPNLYKFIIDIKDFLDRPLDLVVTEFGIREITLEHNTDDMWVQEVSTQSNRLWSIKGKPYPWTFVVNKQRIFIKGSNFLPTDSLFRFSKERYELFLEQAKEANLNMLRVWGGGIFETDDFFQLCNRKGILLWVDFWLSCADYPLLPHELFLKSAENMVKTLRNHPSLAIWCGGNEYNPDADENKELVTKLGNVCATNDPTRPFRRGSPYKGDRHGGILKLPSRTSNKYNGDILNDDQRLVLFRSEVAVLRSAPVLESLKKFISDKNIWPINKDIWEYHHAVILEQQRDAVEYKSKVKDIEHWIMGTQLTHSLNRQYNLEYCRLSKYKTSGILEWSLNGTWPSFHREMIDYYGVPKPVFFAYKRSSQDLIVVADIEKYIYDAGENFAVPIYVVNDSPLRKGELKVSIEVYDKKMNIVYHKTEKIVVEKDISILAFKTDWIIPSEYKKQVLYIYLELKKEDWVVADNFYWIGISNYLRPSKILNISGYWKYQVGKEKKESEWKDTLLPSYWKKPQGPPNVGEKVFYKKKIVIPEEWTGTAIELYSAGIEGNDRILFNGKEIGSTEEEMSILLRPDELTYTEELEQKGKFAAVGVKSSNLKNIDSDTTALQNVRISADPFTTPNLIKRFYDIPEEIINFGGKNTVEMELFGDYATGISEDVFIRAKTPDVIKSDIINYYNKSEYFADIGSLPEVNDIFIDVLQHEQEVIIPKNDEFQFSIILKNNSKNLAFFVHLGLLGLGNEAGIYFSDNYFYMLPKHEKKVIVKIKNNMNFNGTKKIQFELSGWNVQTKKVPKIFTLILK